MDVERKTWRPMEDPVRENRIVKEIVVDAYDPWERAMGWYYYLQNNLDFPFRAECVSRRKMSLLVVGEEVSVTGQPDEDDCAAEMMVFVDWKGRDLAVPLSQIEPIGRVNRAMREAVADWHYWVQMGYRF